MKKLFVLGSILFLLILFLVFLLIFSFKNLKDNNKALKYFNKGDFKAASKIFNKIVKNNPNNNDILINSSGVDYKLNKFDEAKSKYNRVISSSSSTQSDKFIAYYDLGDVEFKQGNLKEAVDFYKEALKINPSDKDSKYNLELALKKSNEKSPSQKQDEKQKQKQNEDKPQENKKAQDLKKQMEQNDKAQEKNKKQQEQENKNSKGNNEQKSKQQENLEKEKQRLEKQRQEISDKIKDLQNEKLNKNKNIDNIQKNKNIPKESEKENKDTPTSVILNYYNESDKNTQRPKKNFKGYQVTQMQKDW
ncbi:MAG: tetratricopeptide repeat protein [Endomicrobium sp.]|jgi:tetratricopeptide (TPR) repeat protein|nr:tetratricopeptide repeat protein [Endomicrobium sp.]